MTTPELLAYMATTSLGMVALNWKTERNPFQADGEAHR